MSKNVESSEPLRLGRKNMEGVVVSDRMNKTRVVSVARLVRHAFYEKVMRKTSKFYVHDEGNQSIKGDLVEIASTRPMSKSKRWRLVKIVKSVPRPAAGQGAASK